MIGTGSAYVKDARTLEHLERPRGVDFWASVHIAFLSCIFIYSTDFPDGYTRVFRDDKSDLPLSSATTAACTSRPPLAHATRDRILE
jgi:hypothetical protein